MCRQEQAQRCPLVLQEETIRSTNHKTEYQTDRGTDGLIQRMKAFTLLSFKTLGHSCETEIIWISQKAQKKVLIFGLPFFGYVIKICSHGQNKC